MTNITFEKIHIIHKQIIFNWLAESHVQEFWDNTQAHKDDILNFIEGRITPSDYFKGQYVYWLGSIDTMPYCLIMTIIEKLDEDRPDIKNQHLSTTGSTYSLDFMIGNKEYLGKGLAAITLIEFTKFFKNNYDTLADTFFIDPNISNTKAKHVYEKAGFTLIDKFIMQNDGCFDGQGSYFLVKKM